MASVDVAIPNYNYGHFLAECVESVLSQGIDDLRVLVIDNASTDGSDEIARNLAARDPRVEVIVRTKNLGPHSSFNDAIDWAEADYFTVLCADDLLSPGSLARSVGVLDRNPNLVMCYGRSCGAVSQLPEPGVVAESLNWQVEPGLDALEGFCRTGICDVSGCAVLVRTEVQKEVGHYRKTLPHTDDFEMWMRFCLMGDVARTDAIQGVLRVHGANQSTASTEKHLLDILNCEDAFESFFANEGRALPDGRRLRHLALRSLGQRAYWSAVSHMLRGKRGGAGPLFACAGRLAPASPYVPPLGYLMHRQDLRTRARAILSRASRRQSCAATAR